MFGKIKYWFKNYWYYYKWIVIVAAFFIAVIIFCATQSQNSGGYDVQILYTGPHFFTTDETDKINSSFISLMSSDYDGNGKKKVDLIAMPAFTSEQITAALGEEKKDDVGEITKYAQYTVSAVEGSFSNQVFVGDAVICLLDEFWYNRLLENGGLVKLKEILGYTPSNPADDYSVMLKDLYAYEFFESLHGLPENTRICFRTMPTSSAFTGKKSAEKNYEQSKLMLKDIFSFGKN